MNPLSASGSVRTAAICQPLPVQHDNIWKCACFFGWFFFTPCSCQVEAFSQFWVLVLSSILLEGLCFVLQVCSSCNCSFIFYFSLSSVFFMIIFIVIIAAITIYALAVWYCMKGDLQRRCSFSNFAEPFQLLQISHFHWHENLVNFFFFFFCFPIKLANKISPFLAFSFNCSLLTILSV